MRKPTVLLLVLTTFMLPVASQRAHAVGPPEIMAPHPAAANPLPWIVRFFGNAVLGWITGKGLDYAVDRARLALVGRASERHLLTLSQQPHVSASQRTSLLSAASTFRTISITLERRDLSDEQARRMIASLRSDMASHLQRLNRELEEVERRLYSLELQQRQQLRMIVDSRGEIVDLQNQVVDLDGRVVSLTRRVGSLERRTQDLETVVYPDPSRYLRHGTYLSLFGLYGNATALDRDAALGGGVTIQANLGKWFGVYGDLAIIPLKASDITGPEGSSLSWITFPAVVGLALNLAPPQSPISIQVGGGGGLAYSALRYYPPDYDPEQANWDDVTSVANVIGAVKVDIGAAPPLSRVEPIVTAGYFWFVEPLEYQSPSAISNAGRELWYLSVGLRFRSNLPGDRVRKR